MKPLFAAVIAFLLTTINATAAENTLLEDDAEKPLAVAAKTEASAENEPGEWKPHFVVTLQTSKHGPRDPKQQTVEVPFYKTQYEDREVSHGTNKSVARVAVRRLAYRKELVTVYRSPNATLYCDDITFRLAKSEHGGGEFDCTGKLRLFIGMMSISAESGSLKNGQLQLTNAEIRQVGTTATAESLTLKLRLHGVSASTFDLPVPTVPAGMTIEHSLATPEDTASKALKPRPDEAFKSRSSFSPKASRKPQAPAFEGFDNDLGE